MAVIIRLKRMGSKKRPFYRLVAADSRYQRDGRFLEILGYYDPMAKPFKLSIEREKVLRWLGNGAQMSDTTQSLLRKDGIVQEFNREKISLRASRVSDKETQVGTPDDGEEKADSEE